MKPSLAKSVYAQKFKAMMDFPSGPQYRFLPAEVRLSSDKKRRTWVINTSAKDSYGTVIDPNGGSFERYRNNPVVLINHDMNRVAASSTVTFSDGRIIASIDEDSWDMEDPEIAKWKRKVDKGLVRGASIGFEPLKWQEESSPDGTRYWRITEWELFEWSIVTIPANSEALKRSAIPDATLEARIAYLEETVEALQAALEVRTVEEGLPATAAEPDPEPTAASPAVEDRAARLTEASQVLRTEILRALGRA